MKKVLTVLFLIFFLGMSNAQQASDYFPSQTGFEWRFKAIPLDSASNPITALTYYRMDKFESVANYNGRLANIVQTKSGPLLTILIQPYLDSLFYSTEGSIGYEYFSIKNISEILGALDSAASGYIQNFSFLEFFSSLQNWYDNYRFASPAGSEYTMLQKDTTITFNLPPPIPVPFRFKYVGTRLQDTTIQTVLGNLDCKRFLLQWEISYFLLTQWYPLLTTNDTIWIAQNNWIVQDIIPGQYVQINILSFQIEQSIPGLDTRLTDEIVSVADEKSVPAVFSLEQNYPNPFNPSTKIRYAVSSLPDGKAGKQFVSLKIYNLLGKEVATLINEEKSTGTYEIKFDGKDLPSGIYFYKLQAGSFVETKKMILMK